MGLATRQNKHEDFRFNRCSVWWLNWVLFFHLRTSWSSWWKKTGVNPWKSLQEIPFCQASSARCELHWTVFDGWSLESFLSSTKALGGLCTAKEDVMKKLVMDGDTYGYFILYIVIVYCYSTWICLYTCCIISYSGAILDCDILWSRSKKKSCLNMHFDVLHWPTFLKLDMFFFFFEEKCPKHRLQ